MKKTLLIAFLLAFAPLHAGEKYTVFRVYDGDTISVERDGERQSVRLIGIDCPESRRNRKAYKDSQKSRRDVDTMVVAGKKATAFVKTLVQKGDTVRLEFDVTRRDRYRRLLAYVYLEDGRMLNEVIIASGYASPMTIPPNVKHRDRFAKAYREAREQRLGLWE